MPLAAPIPLRDEEVVALGRATRLKYAGMSIEDVARNESIILQIVSFAELHRGGISVFQPVDTFYVFESLVDDDCFIESRYPLARSTIKLITLAYDYVRDGEHIAIEQIFWHEYYHMNWSPELAPYDPDAHEYATHGVLDAQDENRADLFAAAVLIDDMHSFDTPHSLAARCNITLSLAERALHLEHNKRLFSRDWTPVYQ